MTQSQIDRLRECKRKADELQRELSIISKEMSEWVSLENSNNAPIKNAQQITGIYVMAFNLSTRLNATIL